MVGDGALEWLLQLDGVLAQAVDADACEVIVGVNPGEKLGLMDEVKEGVVDRGSGQQKHGLVLADLMHAPPAGTPGVFISRRVAMVAEVVCLVDDDDVGPLREMLDFFCAPACGEIGVGAHENVGELANSSGNRSLISGFQTASWPVLVAMMSTFLRCRTA